MVRNVTELEKRRRFPPTQTPSNVNAMLMFFLFHSGAILVGIKRNETTVLSAETPQKQTFFAVT